jgi:histidine triad (HIT) family protein
MPTCPFCHPSDSDVILIDRAGVLAVCDARPIVVGHLLVVSRSHIPSVFDLPVGERAEFRLVQARITAAVQAAFGDVGSYEHGRSAVCRFGVADGGHTHAHVHVLPAAFDLIGESTGVLSLEPPPGLSDHAGLRYLYQKLGINGLEEWSAIHGPRVPRHFVRTAFQDELTRRGIPWLPIGTDPANHDETIEETATIIRQRLE